MFFSFCKHIISNSQSFNSLLDSKINGHFLFQLDTYILGLQHKYLCAYGIHLDSCVRWFIFFSNHCDVWSFPPRSWLAPRHSGGWLCTHCSIQKRMSWQLGTLVFFYTVFSMSQHPLLQVDTWHQLDPALMIMDNVSGTSFVHLVAALFFQRLSASLHNSHRQNKIGWFL